MERKGKQRINKRIKTRTEVSEKEEKEEELVKIRNNVDKK